MIKRGRKDGNHNELKRVFENMGCSVLDLYNAGIPGCPDIIVGVAGKTLPVEIKNPDTRYGRAGLNSSQTAFQQEWRGGPLYVVSSADEVVALVNNARRA